MFSKRLNRVISEELFPRVEQFRKQNKNCGKPLLPIDYIIEFLSCSIVGIWNWNLFYAQHSSVMRFEATISFMLHVENIFPQIIKLSILPCVSPLIIGNPECITLTE